ncbi:MAG: hypothetical protein JXK07_10625 [Spirochaetes bacterium]|nr:hypothetical protein [Spirochaetota bacterium]MBN2769280.1 hypothetical protein [Spirochaetota bacterium]
MKLSQDIIESVFRQIETRNHASNNQAIIHSDELKNILSAQLGVSKDIIAQVVSILLDAHKILHIEIIAEDTARNIDRIDGFVVTELSVIRNLKSYFEKQLIILYEKQYHKNMGAASIIKELFGQMHTINMTEIGQILNKTIILGEYEKMIEKDFTTYSHEWQEKKMIELAVERGFRWHSDIPELNEENKSFETDLKTESADNNDQTISAIIPEGMRAVDTEEYTDFTDKSQKYPLNRILNIYGIDFFTKIYFRRYKFGYIQQLIEDRQITRKSDLFQIKEILAVVKKNILKDRALTEHREEIYSLDKAITHAMFIHN